MATTFQTVTENINGVRVIRVDAHHTSDDDFVLDYDMTPSSGSPDIPTSASLVLASTADGTASVTQAAVVTDNTTSYNIRAVIVLASLPDAGVYFLRSTEVHTTAPLNRTPVFGILTIEDV